MATLISAYNPDYSRKASILTGNPDRVTVEVEDNIDADFWGNILREEYPVKEFHFNPYTTLLRGETNEKVKVSGKTRIMKMSEEFNDNHIACVDSDYDWLLDDTTEYGKIIKTNKYMLQTYTYSFENLVCYSSTLSDFCKKTFTEDVEFDFEDFVHRLSSVIYPLLIWSLFLKSRGYVFTSSTWHGVLGGEYSSSEGAINIVAERVKQAISEIEKKHNDIIDAKKPFEEMLVKNKNLCDSNAYMFVRGHDYVAFLLNAVLYGLKEKYTQQYIAKLKESLEGKELGKAIETYNKSTKDLENLICHFYHYKTGNCIYDLICKDVQSVWS